MQPAAAPALRPLAPQLIAGYRKDGFCVVRGLLSAEECATYRAECLRLCEEASLLDTQDSKYRRALIQRVNVWRDSQTMAQLTLHPQLCAWASALAGEPLRLWHDHVLAKAPRNGAPTEFHQDQPYWPHRDSAQPISAWIALQDVPVERGCMSFIPGSQRLTELGSTDLTDAGGLFALRPELAMEPRVTIPLRAGDVTFHHGRTAHRANANDTDEFRVAHIVIYMPRTTRYAGTGHCVTDDQGFITGQVLTGDLFPEI